MPKKSLDQLHESVTVTNKKGWRRFLAFIGPAYLVSVGYMDPGNWATDLQGGAKFGYQLIWVLLLSNLMAILLQSLSARLGIVRRLDLAQVNRETLSIDSFIEKSSDKSDDDKAPKFQIEDKNSSNDSSELLIREERLNALLNALGKMQREDYKQALTLFYLEQKSYAEISEQMNLPLGSVKAFLHRAKSSLKNILIKQGFKG